MTVSKIKSFTASMDGRVSNQILFTWKYIFKLALAYKKELLLANLNCIIASAIYLPVPFIIPSLINEVLLKQPGFFTKTLHYLLPTILVTPALILITAFCLVLLLRLCEQLLRAFQGQKFTLMAKSVILNIRMQLLSHLKNITINEYETLGGGKLAAYYLKDLDTIDDFLGTAVSKVIIAILAILGVNLVMFFINWKVALFVLLFSPFSIILTSCFAKKLKLLKSKQNQAFELFQEAFVETIDAMVQIRADHQDANFIQRLITKAKQVRDDSIAYEWKTEIVNNLASMFLFIGIDLYYLLCMALILCNELSIGVMIAMLQYVFREQYYMNVIVGMQTTFYAADAALTRINKAMNFATEPEYATKSNPFQDSQATTIGFKNVDFSYITNKPILSNININIQPGQKIGIVGTSGSGKSTLVQALLGFYPISAGQITVNNIDIYDIGFELVRENICTVLQNPVLFNDTIRNNLTYGASISTDIIWQALTQAQLASTIIAFDQQLETQIGKGGVRLSGGQRQRLAIARMLLRNPKVVILDEATSALDSKTEVELFQAINSFLATRTTIMIAHRISTIMDADNIVVINNGRIAEQGAHAKLIQLRGIYYSLYTLQQAK